MDLDRFERIVARKGYQPVGKSSLPAADVYVAERKLPGVVISLDPIESQTHYEILWMIATPTSQGQPTFGRTVKIKAADAMDQKTRIQVALNDAATHIPRSRYARTR